MSTIPPVIPPIPRQPLPGPGSPGGDTGKLFQNNPFTVVPPQTGTGLVVPIGTYLLGSLVVVALSNTRAAPLVAAVLVAAIIYNGSQIVGKKKTP